MADITRTVAIIFQGEDKVTVATDGIVRSFKSVEENAGEAAKSAGELDKSLENVGKQEPVISKAATALKVLAASLVVKDFIDANLAFEKFNKAMVAATGSTEAAAREYKFISEVSNRLGIETRSAADAYAKFAAATAGSSLEGEKARIIFEGFSGSLSKMGASSAEISGAFVQLAQGISKGKFELEDLKSIAERFPGFFPKFAESIGLTTAELFDFISAGKITGAEILVFGQQLKDGLGTEPVEGFAASMARLRNALDQTYLILGESGAFDLLIKGLQLGTAAVTGATQVVVLLGNVLEGLYLKMVQGSNFDFGDFMAGKLDEAADKSRLARDALLGVEGAAEGAGEAGAEAGEQIQVGLNKAVLSADELKKSAAEIEKALKALGIDSKVFADPVKDIKAAFEGLSKSAAVTGEQILLGLIGALKSLPPGESVSGLAADIDAAFKGGKLSADEFGQALALIRVRLDDSAPSFLNAAEATKKQTAAVKDSAKETKEAEKAAKDFQLEMEKLASNERIKFIEAKVQLDVARVQADAEKVIAAFDSINTTITSTGDVIRKLFGLFGDLGGLDKLALKDQIDKENEFRQKALDLQKELTQAQIRQMEAQTRSLDRGDAMIQIDGAGLQPHLEAFMWEILRAIQVRVNQDGLKMLLGV